MNYKSRTLKTFIQLSGSEPHLPDRKDLANHIRELKRHVNLHLKNTKEGKHRSLLEPVSS